ncbi:hypothetical protein [Brevibacillus brevis]
MVETGMGRNNDLNSEGIHNLEKAVGCNNVFKNYEGEIKRFGLM